RTGSRGDRQAHARRARRGTGLDATSRPRAAAHVPGAEDGVASHGRLTLYGDYDDVCAGCGYSYVACGHGYVTCGHGCTGCGHGRQSSLTSVMRMTGVPASSEAARSTSALMPQ